MAERNLDFDTVINRRNTKCLKYDFAKARGMPEDVLPMWVADMDFKTSSYVEDALVKCACYGIFGYSEAQNGYFESVRAWMKNHHGWDVQEKWLLKTPGVVFSLAMAVKAYTRPGDAVMVQQPVYYPFSEVTEDNGRIYIWVRMAGTILILRILKEKSKRRTSGCFYCAVRITRREGCGQKKSCCGLGISA